MWFNSKKTNPELIDDVITKELSNSANGKMILLHGAWGSGKTFRWEKKIKPNIKNKKHKIYVSLFGMQDAEDLKREIYMQAMNINFFKFLWKFIVLLIIFLSILGYLAHKDILSFKSINSSDLMQIIPVLVFFLLFLIFFSKQILLFTMDKIIGLNHNTVPITKFLPPKKTVFCFDDFERIAKCGQPDSFLGYCNKLSKIDGYSILFIADISYDMEDISKQTSKNKETLIGLPHLNPTSVVQEYKEKLFDKSFEHNSNLPAIINEYNNPNINDTLREHLLKWWNIFQQAYNDKNLFDDDVKKCIETSHDNIRIFNKIIDNMKTIYDCIHIEDITHNTHNKLIKFVCSLTILRETGYGTTYKEYEENLTKNMFHDDEKKHFHQLFLLSMSDELFESIYNLLSKGEKTSDLEKELFPEKYLTEFEKMLSEFFDKNYLYYRHKDIIAYYNKIQEILKRKTKLFSSYYTMVSALNRYAWLATCTYKQTIKAFLAENCTNIKKTILSAQIAFEALKRSPIDLHNIDNEIYEENIKLINQNLQRAALSYLIDEINDTPDTIMHHFFDYTDGKNKYYKDIVCILLMSDHKFFNLEELAETNYSDFIHICERIAEFVLEKNNSDYKLICELSDYPETAYNNLLDKLLQILKEQANGMSEYSSEAKNYARYVKLFKRRKMI